MISKLIIQAKQNNFTQYQQDVKLFAFKMVGDPGIVSKWAPFENATESEIYNLTQARLILNEWITKEFISVFFEKCINDERRKQFWLNMSPHISAFKVFGPSNIWQTLRMDKRISDFVDARFQRTQSNIQVAAFMMQIGEYKLIEFSDQGYAFYAYKNDNPKAPSWDGRYNSVGELRDGILPMLVHRQGDNVTDTNPEGRLPHNNSGDINWERVFAYWIQENLGIRSA
ncbi:MAG: EH signature domain-containing protein [Candidatus Desantisbacteria bacterium]